MNSSNSHRQSIRKISFGFAFLAFGAVCCAVLYANWRPLNGDAKTSLDRPIHSVAVKNRKDLKALRHLVLQGDSALAAGSLAEARRSYREALEIRETSKAPWLGLARLAERQGNTGEARIAYKKFLTPSNLSESSKATDPLIMIRYSELCRNAGDLSEERWINRLILQTSHHGQEVARYYENPEPPEGNDGALRARAEVAAGAAAGSWSDGIARYEESLRHYRAAIAANPRDAVAYYGIGRRLEDANKDMEALQAYRTAKELGTLAAEIKKRLEDNIESVERNRRHIVYSGDDLRKIPSVTLPGPLPGPHKFPGVVKPGYKAEFRNGKWEITKSD